MGRKIKTHGNFWYFIAEIQKQEHSKSIAFQQQILSAQQNPQRNKHKERNEKIIDTSKALEEGNLTVTEFLTRLTYHSNKLMPTTSFLNETEIYEEMEDDSFDDDEDDEIMDSDTVEKNMGIVCALCSNNKKNVLFLPCAHVATCIECFKLHQLKRCPTCNSKIASHMNIRL